MTETTPNTNPNNPQHKPKPHKQSKQIFFSTDPELKQTFKQTEVNLQKYINMQSKYQVNPVQSNLSKKSLGSNRVLSKIQQRLLMNKYNNVRYAATTPQDCFGKISGEVVTYQQKQYTSDKNVNKLIEFNQSYHNVPPQKQSSKTTEPQQRILIEKTLVKPKFGFKNMVNQTIDDTFTKDELISFDSSSVNGNKRGSDCSLNLSKSASNFQDILKMEDDKVNLRIIKNGELQGYMLSKIDRKEENIAKRLQEIKKNNQLYDTKIRQKQREIQLVKKRMQKQHKQLQKYQSKMVEAYDNVDQDPDCLLISSRNYQSSNTKMQTRIKNKTKIGCFFQGISRKLSKQILYGKCMILQSDLIQIGFDNTAKPGLIELYLTVKQNLLEMQITVENANQNGYVLRQEDFTMVAHNIPAGKRIKLKINIDYVGNLKDRVGLMALRVLMKINQNSVFMEKAVLPFSLYRNFITESWPAQKKNQKKSPTTPTITTTQNYDYKYVTQWQNCCDQFIKNPKSYLEKLFKSGKWIEDNIYHIDLLFKQTIPKSINILVNCRNFAIEMNQTMNIDVVMAVGNFLARYRDKEMSKGL